MPFAIGGNQLDTGYDVSNSIRFDDAVGSFLQRVAGTNTGEDNATLSFWFKLGNIKSANNGGHVFVQGGTSGFSVMQIFANKIYIGKPGNADNAFFQGHFSSFALFDAALSSSDVSTIYNSGSPNIDLTTAGISSLVAFLPLDEASGNFIDRTDTGADGVPTNSPTQGVEDVP